MKYLCLVLTLAASPIFAAELSLSLPLGRTVYQCNEWIPVTVLGLGASNTAGEELVLRLRGQDDSSLTFHLPLRPASAGAAARSVEHLRVNGWLLRPGNYTVEVTSGTATARTNITVHSHVRRSDFKLIDWSSANKDAQILQGEDSFGYNVLLGSNSEEVSAGLIPAGVDFMACCTMGGGHQMDLRQECDWSDPYVVRGGTRRVARRAFMDRTHPNVLGVHFYDEPGLTWAKDPESGEMSPHAVPWQRRSYEAAFGSPAPDWKRVAPAEPADAARWASWARWKLSFMDAAWKDAQFEVSAVEPEFLSVTQSQYGYTAFCDGYYFNVVRSLPITSGHGGYHDFGPGYFNPSLFLEIARAHDWAKPNWYLPTWYGSTTDDEFRLEQYLCLQCGLQGVMTPPEIDPGATLGKSKATQGVVESNHLLQRLGPVFNTMRVTRPPVALLYSLSQVIHTQTLDRKVGYAHQTAHGRNLVFSYLAGKLLQHQFLPVLDEDVLDGTLAAHHKAIILTSMDYLDSDVVAALEQFAARGGLVLITRDSTLEVKGAVTLDAAAGWPDAPEIEKLKQAGKASEADQLMKMRQALAGAQSLANAIRFHLERAGIRPPLTSSEPGIVVTRHAAGDVEYLFAVNATHDLAGDPMLGVKSVTAVLGLPDDGRPVYDAVHSMPAQCFKRQSGALQAEVRFGPGQMRVFARTARPIASVRIATPVLHRDFARSEAPLVVEMHSVVEDVEGGIVAGAIPLQIVVTDPLGEIRYDLYRETEGGQFKLSLPLGLNDPAGEWKITMTELLSGKAQTATFRFEPVSTCNAAVGAVWRAVHWPADRDRIFRFFRTQRQVTLVVGTSAFDIAAAERLKTILLPWNIRCDTMRAADASEPRSLSPDEAATWVGLDYAAQGQIRPGASNAPALAGFSVKGPVILLGNPEDNPLVSFLWRQHFLPFQPEAATMPGPGRGYIAWQREAIGVNQESVALLAYDSVGMEEAVGTLYEMLAGLEPLTPLLPARRSEIQDARRTAIPPGPVVEWSVVLPDRIEALRASADSVTALTSASVLAELRPDGSISSQRVLDAAAFGKWLAEMKPGTGAASPAIAPATSRPTRLKKMVSSNGHLTAVAYWGGAIDILDDSGTAKFVYRGPQDITALAWENSRLLVGDADGNLAALKVE